MTNLDGMPIGHLISMLADMNRGLPVRDEDRAAMEAWRDERARQAGGKEQNTGLSGKDEIVPQDRPQAGEVPAASPAAAECEHEWANLKAIPKSRTCLRCGLGMTRVPDTGCWVPADPTRPVLAEVAPASAEWTEDDFDRAWNLRSTLLRIGGFYAFARQGSDEETDGKRKLVEACREIAPHFARPLRVRLPERECMPGAESATWGDSACKRGWNWALEACASAIRAAGGEVEE